MTEQELIEIIKTNKYTHKKLQQFFKDNKDKKSFFEVQFEQYKDRFTFFVFVKYFYLGVLDKTCLCCGRLLSYQQIRKKRYFCSRQCSFDQESMKKRNFEKYGVEYPQQLPQFKQKLKTTNLQRYGVQSNLQLKQFRQRSKKTCLQKYGTQYITQSQHFKNKSKKTMLQKYGVQSSLQNQQIKNKHKKTMLQKYGVESALESELFKTKVEQTNIQRYGENYRNQFSKRAKQTSLQRYGEQSILKVTEFREKIKRTFRQKYGVQQIFESQQIKNKIKQTNLEKYGVQCCFSNNQVRNKIKQTNLEKYGSQSYVQSDEFKCQQKKKSFDRIIERIKKADIYPLFSIDDYTGYYNVVYKWKCLKCGDVFYQRIHSTFIDGQYINNVIRCYKCNPILSGYSYQEKEMFQFIKNNVSCQVLQSDFFAIKPQQLDIYIPQKNIAFEFDGLYWHGQRMKDKNYHLRKTQMCIEKGIQLVHIFEDQWVNKQDIVKDRIKNILGIYDNRIFARKCIIKEIKPSVCKQFLDNNHIQGSDNSKIRLGLFYKDQLISVMTFSKPRFNKNYEYELVRFASKLGYQVIGGASKLLKYFEINYQPKSLISYADRRYSNGKLYYALDFSFLNNSEPNYFWYKRNVKYTRYQCQKHKLKELLGQDKFNSQLSEVQNMYLNGYNRIYDCGNMVFVKLY